MSPQSPVVEDIPRERREKLAKAVRQLQIREHRQLQSSPRGGLLEFIRYFWHVLEPVDPFIEGWPLECLCAHLEGISNGDMVEINGVTRLLNRLNVNVPPGFMKSLCTNVFFPAWEWGPLGRPHLRYIAFSYASELTERDNAKFRDLVTSDAYRELWGHVFRVVGDGKIRVTNDQTGFKFASSLGGVGTGERGHRVLCLAGDQKVLTEHGAIDIATLVQRRISIRAWSYNETLKTVELKPIVGWHQNPGRPLVRITTAKGGVVVCTHDHEIYTERGKRIAAALGVGDRLLTGRQIQVPPRAPTANVVNSADAYPKFFGKCRTWFSALRDLPNALLGKALSGPGMIAACSAIASPLGKVQARPHPSSPNATDCGGTNAVFSSEGDSAFLVSARNVTHQFFREHGRPVAEIPMPLAIGYVLSARSIFKVAKTAVASVAVLVAYFLAFWARPHKSRHEKTVHDERMRLPVLAQVYTGIAIPGMRRLQHFAFDLHRVVAPLVVGTVGVVAQATRALTDPRQASDASVAGNLVATLESNHWSPEFDPIVSVEAIHETPSATYCITVEGNHNLLCGDSSISVITANCDDLNKIKGTAESDESRNSTSTWATEAMQNRLNDLQRDAIINIQQRTHEEDVSGTILKQLADEYCALILPMQYEPNRHFTHYTGWNDGQDPRQDSGELAWPERYPSEVLQSFKRNAYLWSGQYQQNPVPRGGGLFKDDWWQVHEVQRSEGGVIKFVPPIAPIFVLASLDTAYSEKEENDPSALTVWAVHDNQITKRRNILMVDAWAKMLPHLSGPRQDPHPNEHPAAFRRRAMQKWGLAEWVADTCTRRRVNLLIVENKNRAPDVIKEIKKLFADRDWGIRSIDIRGDKWGRAHAITDIFTDEMVHAPAEITEDGSVIWLDWAQDAMTEISRFPRGGHDDILDSMTMAMKYLRDNGYAIRSEEQSSHERAQMMRGHQKRTAIYPV